EGLAPLRPQPGRAARGAAGAGGGGHGVSGAAPLPGRPARPRGAAAAMAGRQPALPARHGPVRPRHRRPDLPWRPGVAADRLRRHPDRGGHRDRGGGARRLLRRRGRHRADARDGGLPDAAQLPAAPAPRGGVRLRSADDHGRHRRRVLAARGAADARGVPFPPHARVHAGRAPARLGRRAPDPARGPAQRAAARPRLRQRGDGRVHPAGKRAVLPPALGPQRAVLGQPDRPRAERAADGVVRVGDPGGGDPAHHPRRVAGGAGAERRAEPAPCRPL
ncbi:MAG: ABC transporter, permease protein 2 (cluster 5, nickel/peptides/opines), partial [uncultured Acetobacteraceae bacterium]